MPPWTRWNACGSRPRRAACERGRTGIARELTLTPTLTLALAPFLTLMLATIGCA